MSALFDTYNKRRGSRGLTVILLVPVSGRCFPFALEKGVSEHHGMVESHAMVERKRNRIVFRYLVALDAASAYIPIPTGQLPYPFDIPLHAMVAQLPFSVWTVDEIFQRVFPKYKPLGILGAVMAPCPAARNVDSKSSATHDGAPAIDRQPPNYSIAYLVR